MCTRVVNTSCKQHFLKKSVGKSCKQNCEQKLWTKFKNIIGNTSLNKSYEQFMTMPWTASHEQVNEQVMKNSLTSGNSWKSFEPVMNKIWTIRDRRDYYSGWVYGVGSPQLVGVVAGAWTELVDNPKEKW